MESWEIDINVPVPSQQSVNATFLIIENEYDASWESEVVFNGCFVAYLYGTYKFEDTYKENVYEAFKNTPGFKCW